MPSPYEYILSLQDQMSGKLGKITAASELARNKFEGLNQKTKALQETANSFAGSITHLKQKIDLLQAERDLLPGANIGKIQKYNAEINRLNREVTKLENVSGGKFKTWSKDAFSSLPGFATNPLVLAGTAVAASAKMSMGWSTGMAKINATAQLTQGELDVLGGKLKKMGADAGADIGGIPDAYEKILSQTGDVTLSTDIFSKALQGAKAGFTDINTVADAVARTLSVVGSKNTNAQQVIDTLFAAKRVGAGEFKDFATYIPQVVASAGALNIGLGETAGMFAYFTAKGFEASYAATLMNNVFSLLGKTDVTDNMRKMGIDIYDATGKMLPMVDVMGMLSKKLGGLSTEAKSDWLDKAGIKDAEAKKGLIALSSEVDRLGAAIAATSNPAGELAAALEFAKDKSQPLTNAWSKIQVIAVTLGGVIMGVLTPAFMVLNPVLTAVSWLIEKVVGVFNWFIEGLTNANPWVIGLATAIGILTTSIALNYAWTHRSWVLDKLAVMWKVISTASNWSLAASTVGLTLASWGLNAALLASPITWVVLGVGALVGAIAICWNKFEGFRQVIYGLWETFKQVFTNIGGFFKKIFSPIIEAVTAIKEGRWGDAAKLIGKGLFNLTPVGIAANAVSYAQEGGFSKGLDKAWDKGKKLGSASFKEDQKGNALSKAMSPAASMATVSPISPGGSTTEIETGKSSGAGKNININLTNLVGKIEIHNTNSTESGDMIKDKLMEALMSLLNDANLAVG